MGLRGEAAIVGYVDYPEHDVTMLRYEPADLPR